MIKINEFEGKTYSEAVERATIQLNTSTSEIYIIDTVVEKGKLFKSNKHIIKVIEKTNLKEYIKEVFKNLSQYMNLDLNLEIRIEEDIINIVLVSSNNAILIGKEGKTLEALQILIRQIVKNTTNLNVKINLDIANYKSNKIKTLEHEIKKIAREVQKTKIDVSLDPMNSFERRTIHNMINNMDNLSTESIGEGKERHIVIKYTENSV